MNNNLTHPISIMGVINANEDSFFQGSRFEGTNALKKIEQMIQDGANIIDVGGVSSRPGSKPVSSKVELSRVKPIIDLIFEHKLYEKVKFSLDSYEPEVLEYALNRGFTIINDITGLKNDKVCELAAKYKATVVIMHMQNNPETMQKNPSYENVVNDIKIFFSQRIKKAKDFGIENIVLDVGIGFGKTLEHNLMLIKNLNEFKSFGYEILMAASRKSMIDKITPTPTEQRLPGTLAIHLKSIENGATWLRVHDVKEHFQAVKVLQEINNI